MKTCLIIFALAFLAAVNAQSGKPSAAQEAALENYRAQCRAELGVTQTEQDALSNLQFENLSQKLKCFFFCISNKAQLISADGVVDVNRLYEVSSGIVGAELTNKLRDNCWGLQGTDTCDKAAKITECDASYKASFILPFKY